MTRLRRRRFDDDELVDAGLVSRRHPDGTVRGLLSHRQVVASDDGS